ncbi:hypothetical protein DPMN_071128 [Dreissena polymorpha]|uniref:Uncharacterized protein n=1 Tax=Dreissena polymorpha TaxID=45954 RepID=A0A9D3Z401_DREPO|nr:hypothetical protein DPMN_071128 [Dreissena polymorpha]
MIFLGKREGKKKPWVTKEIIDLCDRRIDLMQEKYTSHESRIPETWGKVRMKMKEAKKELIDVASINIDKESAAFLNR